MTGCAVRGIETSAGRVSAVVTEKGRVACEAAVVAGGAWTSLFCRSLGLDLPQFKVLATVQRTAPVADGPGPASWGPGLALRKRLDGGYTVSFGSTVADIVPDGFRYFRPFFPVLRSERKFIRFRFGRPFFDEWRLQRSWRLDGVSPFERVRILDPAPDAHDLAAARVNLEKRFPAFRGVPTVARWAGLIDVTPDVVPAIGPVERIPGLYVSTGYSGHGFGIGLGAGRLTADLASGRPPLVDPSAFRLSRFSDGTKLEALTGL